MQELKDILKKLRDPKTGCPWDRVQTFKSIAPNTIEEAYEVLEAVENNDYDAIKEEIGDLLLHVLFYADMAEEAGKFNFDDVVNALCLKLIKRHPHVFGNAEKAQNEKEALEQWEKVKAKERIEEKNFQGTLDGIAVTLPPLTRALKLQKRAARVGFDWKNPNDAFLKLKEELNEVELEINKTNKKFELLEEEMGDLLFSVINVARKLNVNPDTALRKTNQKFQKRFAFIETELAKNGLTPADADINKMEELWEKSKKYS